MRYCKKCAEPLRELCGWLACDNCRKIMIATDSIDWRRAKAIRRNRKLLVVFSVTFGLIAGAAMVRFWGMP